MRAHWRGIAALVALSAVAQAPAAQDEPKRQDSVVISATGEGGGSVIAEADRTEPALGELVQYTIRVTREPGETYTVPTDLDFGKLTVVDFNEESRALEGAGAGEEGEKTVVETYRWKLGAYELEEMEIPEVVILRRVGDAEATQLVLEAIPIAVTGSLSEEEQAAIQGPEQINELLAEVPGPREVRVPFYLPLYILGALLAGALLAWAGRWWWLRREQQEAEAPPPPPPRPAHEVALEKLDALRDEGLPQKGQIKIFHFSLSEILREYLGGRYDFDALEMTTTELNETLRVVSPAGLELNELRGFLEHCDMVKFAKFEPTEQTCHELLHRAENMVQKTKKVVVRMEEAEADGAGGGHAA